MADKAISEENMDFLGDILDKPDDIQSSECCDPPTNSPIVIPPGSVLPGSPPFVL